jgi:hypothetical protein
VVQVFELVAPMVLKLGEMIQPQLEFHELGILSVLTLVKLALLMQLLQTCHSERSFLDSS